MIVLFPYPSILAIMNATPTFFHTLLSRIQFLSLNLKQFLKLTIVYAGLGLMVVLPH